MKTVYLYDAITNEFMNSHKCQPNTINPKDFDVPWNSLESAPPKTKKNEVAIANLKTGRWDVKLDFRGTVYYTENRERHEIVKTGEVVPRNASTKEPPSEYHTLKSGEWTLDAAAKAKQLRDAIARSSAEIDATVAAVYAKFQRFEMEYKLRESQAQAFKDGGYKGKMPEQVAAYAKPAELAAKAACDDILASAHRLRVALDKLGVQRMRKVALRKLASIKAVETLKNEVLGDVAKIAGAL